MCSSSQAHFGSCHCEVSLNAAAVVEGLAKLLSSCWEQTIPEAAPSKAGLHSQAGFPTGEVSAGALKRQLT